MNYFDHWTHALTAIHFKMNMSHIKLCFIWDLDGVWQCVRFSKQGETPSDVVDLKNMMEIMWLFCWCYCFVNLYINSLMYMYSHGCCTLIFDRFAGPFFQYWHWMLFSYQFSLWLWTKCLASFKVKGI